MAATTRSKVKAEIDEYRAVPSSKYRYVCNEEGIPRKRLIVFEENDQVNVRQYNNLVTATDLWKCLKCEKMSKFNRSIFMASLTHSCKPITYQEALRQQNQIKAKMDRKKAAAVGSGNGGAGVGVGRNVEEVVDENKVEDVKGGIRERNPTYINNLPKREILPADYVFGVDTRNTVNARVFVFEENSRSLVHQYSKFAEKYYCRGCLTFCGRKTFSFFKNDIFCVQPIHLCKPQLYEKAMEEQRKIKEKFEEMEKAAARISQQPSTSSSFASSTPRQSFSVMPAVASIKIQLQAVGSEELGNLRNPGKVYKPAFLSPTTTTVTKELSPDFREVDVLDFEYGFNEHGERKKRIVVYEINRKFVREYIFQETGVWKCLNCSIGTAVKDDDIVTVSIKHECQPIPVQISKDRQRHYEALYKAANQNSTFNDSRNQMSDISFDAIFNRQSGNGNFARNNKRMSTAGTLEQKGTMIKKSRQSFEPTSNSYGRENWNLSFNGTSSSTTDSGSQRSQLDDDPTAVKLYKPSSYTLEKLCQKLGLDYCDKAYLFWHNIKIDEVSLSSIPEQVYPISTFTNPGFSAISLYLTGSEASAFKVKEELNKYFIVNHKTLGESLGQNLSRLDHPLVCQTLYQEAATDLHFETIVHLFKCRIGIYAEGCWKRYGSWTESDADFQIFLLEKKNDNYYPILSLK